MTGPKLNEGQLLVADDQPTTKATAKYLRGSAYKAREVLDLIRGLDVRRADEVLQFTTRDVAKDIRKVLASAVANAVHNDEQDAEELFVLACFADEGPTLRRFRPRARGRATRIRKRTCHITIVVARMSEERLEIVQNRAAAQSAAGRRRAGTTAQSRRDRVARSRARAEGLRTGATETPEAATEELPEETPGADADVVDATEVVADEVAEMLEDEAAEQAAADIAESDLAEVGEAEPSSEGSEATSEESVELPDGAVAAPADGSIPDGYPIKGNRNSMKYHTPESRYYDITIAEVFFDTPEHAEAAGFEAPATDTEES
jgi:large subunit ribosomal protein L22